MRLRAKLNAVDAWPVPQLAFFSLAGWLIALVQPDPTVNLNFCGSTGRYWLAVASGGTGPPSAGEMLMQFAPTWLLMLWSCMPLLVIPEIRHLRTLDESRRRWQSALLFALGFVVIWMMAGVVSLVLSIMLAAASEAWQIPPVLTAALVAVGWHMCGTRRHCLDRCHQAPRLADCGLHADIDALGYGAKEGAWCVGACWHLMLAPLLVPQGHFLMMVICTAAMLIQRNDGWLRTTQPAPGHRKAS